MTSKESEGLAKQFDPTTDHCKMDTAARLYPDRVIPDNLEP